VGQEINNKSEKHTGKKADCEAGLTEKAGKDAVANVPSAKKLGR